MPPIEPAYSTPSQLIKYQHGTGNKQLGGGPMNVIVAAGPYTVDSNLDYEPLQALIQAAQKEKPDVLILVSSFVSFVLVIFPLETDNLFVT